MQDVVLLSTAESGAAAAARLCNFPTGHAMLLPAHVSWLDSVVSPLLRGLADPWVDLYGYASHLGSPAFNKRLSFDRCEAVRKHIRAYGLKVSFPTELGVGDSQSTGTALDNSGAWRAVEVYVFRAKPPPKPPPKIYTHKVRLHFRSAALPTVPEMTALANAQRVYDKYKILLEFASGLSMGASAAEFFTLNASDGTCQWNQASDEQKLLDALGGRQGVGPTDVVVYYADHIRQKDGSALNGCAGHLPNKAAVVVSSIGSRWTLGHELGHVLLGPSFSPVHAADATNLMFSPTNNITADPPSLTFDQLKTMLASKFCIAI
jgi:hypothetical protein